jgi:muramoyltetrapeptide carboxypeptidase LdcA involved in peptidoglycan recycling
MDKMFKDRDFLIVLAMVGGLLALHLIEIIFAWTVQ